MGFLRAKHRWSTNGYGVILIENSIDSPAMTCPLSENCEGILQISFFVNVSISASKYI